MVTINLTLSIATALHINGLNVPVKRQRLSELTKTILYYMIPTTCHSEKANLWRQEKDQWLPGSVGES